MAETTRGKLGVARWVRALRLLERGVPPRDGGVGGDMYWDCAEGSRAREAAMLGSEREWE